MEVFSRNSCEDSLEAMQEDTESLIPHNDTEEGTGIRSFRHRITLRLLFPVLAFASVAGLGIARYGQAADPHKSTFQNVEELFVLGFLLGGSKPTDLLGYTPTATLIRANAECGSVGRFLRSADSPEECATRVMDYGGRYFIHSGKPGGFCYLEHTESEDCPEGFVNRTDYNFYEAYFSQPRSHLVKTDVECGVSNGAYLGLFKNLSSCAVAASEKGREFFLYGKRFQEGMCFAQLTNSSSCPEGFRADSFDFYAINKTKVGYTKMKEGAECGSRAKFFWHKNSIMACALSVKAAGGTHFIFGTGFLKANMCWMEQTDSDLCPEGWESDSYDFYRIDESSMKN